MINSLLCQRPPRALESLPPAVTQALARLGENLAIARLRRRESQRAWAKRLGISVPTLIRMERGDPASVWASTPRRCGSSAGRARYPSLRRRAKTAARSRATSARLCAGARSARRTRARHGSAARAPTGAERVSAADYRPADQLHLWLLTVPADPVLVGELHLVRASRGVSLQYADAWLERGFALSEDLPLIAEEFLPSDKETAAGAVDDARPDRWGERVIRFLDKPPRLSLLEYLYFAGDDRFGALGVSTSATEYLPRRLGPLPALGDAARIHELIRSVQDDEPVPQHERRLLAPGVTMGGARPKALLDIDGAQWVIKFADGDADRHAARRARRHDAGRQAGIRVAETQAGAAADGHAVAVKRFDRERGRRIHCLTAHVALRAAAERFGYPELAQLLRRRGVTAGDARRGHARAVSPHGVQHPHRQHRRPREEPRAARHRRAAVRARAGLRRAAVGAGARLSTNARGRARGGFDARERVVDGAAVRA